MAFTRMRKLYRKDVRREEANIWKCVSRRHTGPQAHTGRPHQRHCPLPHPPTFLFFLFFAMGIHSLSLGTPIPFKKGDPARRRKESGRKERERKSVSCRKRKRAAPTIGRTAGSTTPDPRQGQAKCARPRPRCPHLRAMVPLAGTRCTSRARPTNDQRTASRAPCLCCATGARSETTGMTAGSIKPTLLGMERPFHVFHPLLLLMLRQYFCTFDTAKR